MPKRSIAEVGDANVGMFSYMFHHYDYWRIS